MNDLMFVSWICFVFFIFWIAFIRKHKPKYKIGDIVTFVPTEGEFITYESYSYYQISQVGKKSYLCKSYSKKDNRLLCDAEEKSINLIDRYYVPYTLNNNKPSWTN